MRFVKVFFLFFLFMNSLFAENYADSLTLAKIKKLVQKEEEIAVAYKKYLLTEAKIPADLDALKDYLPVGFDTKNLFGRDKYITLSTNKAAITGFDSTDTVLKTNLNDYYYSNKYRTYTKAPLSISKEKDINIVKIILSSKEKFIYDNKENITTINPKTTPIQNKYYLDKNGVFHWYGDSGTSEFSFDKDLIIEDSSKIIVDGKISSEYAKNSKLNNLFYAGMNIFTKNKDGNIDEYLGVGILDKLIKTNAVGASANTGLLHFGNRSGGMLMNGDIYTWGNNINRITGINEDSYTTITGSAGTKNAVVTTLVKQKAKIYDVEAYEQVTNNSTNRALCSPPIGSGIIGCKYSTTNCNPPTGSGSVLCKDIGDKFYSQNYFSSPFRPKFVDFFANTKNGVCGITEKTGELYCGGTTSTNYAFGDNFTHVDTTRSGEMLYRSTFFDGKTDSVKAKKIFANNQLWLILSEDGNIYRWGTEENNNKNGFSGNTKADFNADIVTEITTTENQCVEWKWSWSKWDYVCTKYKDVTTTTTTTISKDINKIPEKITENIPGVSFDDITYTFEDGYRKMAALSTTGDIYLWGMDSNISNMNCTEVSGINLCQPTKVDAGNLSFESIKGGLRDFVALGKDGKYYKINQPKNSKAVVTFLMDSANVLSLDFAIDLTGSTKPTTTVYVSSDNKLNGVYFDAQDTTFKNAINNMLWKTIKVLDSSNAMCGLTTDNQLYCWGMQSYYDGSNVEKSTILLPVFNTNLYDLNKDYLVIEADKNSLTNMTSGTWTDSNSKFVIKYPTYIGGFNYEFLFK